MVITWIYIAICICHSAIFSGLNLGFFGLSRLSLVIHAESKNADASRILKLRQDSHLLLATLLWGNVASNVLLALFAESVLSGVGAFLFSTIGITFLGEIIPQAYLSKHALSASNILVPIIKFYQFLLYPIAKPTALALDHWLGKEKISYFQEKELGILLKKHAHSDLTDLDHLEAIGAINFLKLDDILLKDEGEIIDPKSIYPLKSTADGTLIFPSYTNDASDPFLKAINLSGKKWVIFTNKKNEPKMILNADYFLRECLHGFTPLKIETFCHIPIIIQDAKALLGHSILKLSVTPKNNEDDVIDNDVILFWGTQKKIITGADILGRLLRGIVPQI